MRFNHGGVWITIPGGPEQLEHDEVHVRIQKAKIGLQQLKARQLLDEDVLSEVSPEQWRIQSIYGQDEIFIEPVSGKEEIVEDEIILEFIDQEIHPAIEAYSASDEFMGLVVCKGDGFGEPYEFFACEMFDESAPDEQDKIYPNWWHLWYEEAVAEDWENPETTPPWERVTPHFPVEDTLTVSRKQNETVDVLPCDSFHSVCFSGQTITDESQYLYSYHTPVLYTCCVYGQTPLIDHGRAFVGVSKAGCKLFYKNKVVQMFMDSHDISVEFCCWDEEYDEVPIGGAERLIDWIAPGGVEGYYAYPYGRMEFDSIGLPLTEELTLDYWTDTLTNWLSAFTVDAAPYLNRYTNIYDYEYVNEVHKGSSLYDVDNGVNIDWYEFKGQHDNIAAQMAYWASNESSCGTPIDFETEYTYEYEQAINLHTAEGGTVRHVIGNCPQYWRDVSATGEDIKENTPRYYHKYGIALVPLQRFEVGGYGGGRFDYYYITTDGDFYQTSFEPESDAGLGYNYFLIPDVTDDDGNPLYGKVDTDPVYEILGTRLVRFRKLSPNKLRVSSGSHTYDPDKFTVNKKELVLPTGKL